MDSEGEGSRSRRLEEGEEGELLFRPLGDFCQIILIALHTFIKAKILQIVPDFLHVLLLLSSIQ